MTELQYRRWKTFALRMAHRGCGMRLRKSRRFVAGCVRDVFDLLDSDYIGQPDAPYADWLERVHGWCDTADHATFRDYYGHKSNGGLICDIVTCMIENRNPYRWDAPPDRDYERWGALWGDRIQCCLRAGLDVVCDENGVLGFSAGDLRCMYHGEVPDWVSGGDERWHEGALGGEYKINGTFAEMADEVAIVL